MSGQQQVVSKKFYNHLSSLQKIWKENYNDFDTIMICNGEDSENKQKTTAINVWLFGYDFLQSLLVLTKNSFILIASDKKLKFFDQVKNDSQFNNFNIVLITKDAKDSQINFNQLQNILKNEIKSQKLKAGFLENEIRIGTIAKDFEKFQNNSSGMKFYNCEKFISEVLLIKDLEELDNINKSGKVCNYFEKALINEIEGIIDAEEKKTHNEIANSLLQLIEISQTKAVLKKQNIEIEYVDFSHPPIIQSGGNYQLTMDNQISDNQDLAYDTILTKVSYHYKYYNSSVARTLFIDPNLEQKQTYNNVNKLHTEIILSVQPGKKLKEIYKNGLKFIKENFPEMNENLIPNDFGFATGLEFFDKEQKIDQKNEKVVQQGMVFQIHTNINNLISIDKNYAIQLIDTIIVNDGGTDVVTGQSSRKYEDISYSLQNNESIENKNSKFMEEEEEDYQSQDKENQNNGNNIKKQKNIEQKIRNSQNLNEPIKTRRQQQTREVQKLTNENQSNQLRRNEHQQELRKKKLEQLKERLKNNQFQSKENSINKLNLETLICYKNEDEIPKEATKNQIFADFKKNCLLLPVYGKNIPFHISLIKSVTKIDEPGGTTAQSNIIFPKQKENDNDIAFIKELTFRSKNGSKISEWVKKIKDMQKKWKEFSLQRQNEDENFDQEEFKLIKGQRPVLKDLKVRPAISQKKISGNLECHENGFRYIAQNNNHINVLFSNIKYAFFQPCDNEMIVCLHFNLHKPILIGKKKSLDIQFYAEAGSLSEDLIRNRKSGIDYDEDEELEKEMRKRVNKDFKSFIKVISEIHPNQLQFEKPFRNLGFLGCPLKSSVFLQPTINCLINVIEQPFFVLNLKDIEIACFERMISGLKNFDLVFAFKDYDKPIQRIVGIPQEYSDAIKDWLDKMDILFFECTRNIQWTTVIGEIKKDISGFIEDGGWNAIFQDSESENEEVQDDDSEFTEDEIENESSFSEEDEEDEDFTGEDEVSDDGFEGGEHLNDEIVDFSNLSEQIEDEEDEKSKRREKLKVNKRK